MPQLTQATSALALDKIMLATDFSPVAEKAGEYAKAIARQYSSTVNVIHALYTSDDLTALPERQIRQKDESRLALKQQEFQNAGITTYVAEVSEAPVADALLLMERRFSPDLIVAGTKSKSALGRLVVGSVAEHLIRQAFTPVLTVGRNAKHPADRPVVFQKILLATDYSAAAGKAAELALRLAQAPGAHLWIARVEPGGQPDPQEEVALRARLKEQLPPSAFKWRHLRCVGDDDNPASPILELAHELQADIIVMGARGGSFWLLHLHRGVTQEVLAQAPCPVLTVR